MDLFAYAEKQNPSLAPLAERMRPQNLSDIIGQSHLLGPNKPLRQYIEKGFLPSLILWGPPGCGKTTLARIIAKTTKHHFVSLSAVMNGVKDLREVIKKAESKRNFHQEKTLVFIDEIHRFNSGQQDALLPHIESGLITLIGATTENPSYRINNAVLSRCKVFVLQALSEKEMFLVLQNALRSTKGLADKGFTFDDEFLQILATSSHNDTRQALNTLELCTALLPKKSHLSLKLLDELKFKNLLPYQKNGEEHFDITSAFIKSMRGSNPSAAIYWMQRLLTGGEDPLYIARRILVFASEDIGNADPMALTLALNTYKSLEVLGMPEGKYTLAQAVIYCAQAKKNNEALRVLSEANKDIEQHGPLAVPLKFKSAQTALNRSLGFGKNYKYPPNTPKTELENENYFPEQLKGRNYFE